jgi:Zn-dependent metalloprotease
VTGKTLQFDSYESPDLTAEEAEEIVREDVMTEYEIDTEKIEVSSNEKYILNTKFLGIDDNDKNYVGYVIDVVSGLSFSHRYLLGNKNIGVLSDYSTVAEYPNPIDVEEKIYDADLCGDNIDVSNFTLDNLTSDCIKLVFSNSDQSTYPVVESTTYVSFVHQGVVDFHNSIKERYNRNSYDNANGAYRVVLSNTIGGGYTHMNNNMNIIFATNRTLTDRDLLNLEAARNYTKGVVFHEYGHKVVESTANFEYILEHQSGALHEAYAGFFLMSTINEWNTYGYFYDHDWYEPHYTSYLDGARYDLDGNFLSYHDEEVFFLELFSSHYACNSDNYSPAHHNNPVIMHTWALMSEGSENAHGCQLQGIGKEKTFQIGYRALTTPGYMHASSNYYNWYWAMKHACRDFAQVGGHGITDEDCINVERAMQATKIDQQPVDKPKGPTCYGIEPRVAACVNTPPPGGQSSSEQPENPVPEDDEERSEEPEQDQPSGSGPCDNNAMMPHFRGCYEDGGRMIGVCGMYSEGDCVSTEECEEKAREEGRELPVETLVYDISPDLCGSVQQEEPQEPTSVPESSEIGDNEEIGDTGEKLVCGSHTAPDDRKYVDPCDPCESNSECGGDEPWCHGGFCLE